MLFEHQVLPECCILFPKLLTVVVMKYISLQNWRSSFLQVELWGQRRDGAHPACCAVFFWLPPHNFVAQFLSAEESFISRSFLFFPKGMKTSLGRMPPGSGVCTDVVMGKARGGFTFGFPPPPRPSPPHYKYTSYIHFPSCFSLTPQTIMLEYFFIRCVRYT